VPPIEIPEVVATKAGAAGCAWWLDALPALVAELAARWDLRVGRPFRDGTEAWVAPARRSDGRAVVLKLHIPRPGDGAVREATVLRLAGGRGCAELLAHDAEHHALLLERLGPSLAALGLPAGRRHRVLADLAADLWRPAASIPAADRAVLATGAEKAAWLIDHVRSAWEDLGRPCQRATVEAAVACAERRGVAHGDTPAVLNHGDVHQWNALRADGAGGWKLVDPDGLIAEPAYDLGIVMREDPRELAADLTERDPRRRARLLAELTGCDPVAIWEWGVIERVSTGLVATRIGLQPVGRDMLAVADRLAGA
jgi:streptomycin 6-kinase